MKNIENSSAQLIGKIEGMNVYLLRTLHPLILISASIFIVPKRKKGL